MSDAPPGSSGSSKGLWIIILLIFLGLVIYWFANPMNDVGNAPEPAPAPTAQPTDLAEEPEGPAVDVTLPQTPMTNVPAESAETPAPPAE